jgi:hypothetical protein
VADLEDAMAERLIAESLVNRDKELDETTYLMSLITLTHSDRDLRLVLHCGHCLLPNSVGSSQRLVES